MLHLELIWGELGLLRLKVTVNVVVHRPFFFLERLDLLFDELNEQSCERVMVKLVQQAIENLSLLMEKQVLKRGLLLLVQKLFHDLEEIACQDWKRVLILVEELAHSVH